MKTENEILNECGITFGLANSRVQVKNAMRLSQSEGFNKGFDEANLAREEQIKNLQFKLLEQDRIIMKLESKLETAKEFINYCKSQPDVYVHANKCLTEIE
jgi:cob(I)alamin adenosyltransferase